MISNLRLKLLVYVLCEFVKSWNLSTIISYLGLRHKFYGRFFIETPMSFNNESL